MKQKSVEKARWYPQNYLIKEFTGCETLIAGSLKAIAVNIDKIAAVTYDGLVKELGKDCVDKSLWKDVPQGDPIFFYSLKLESEFVK